MADETQENGTIKLNEDYLAELEEAAKGRYTEEDEDFMKVLNVSRSGSVMHPDEFAIPSLSNWTCGYTYCLFVKFKYEPLDDRLNTNTSASYVIVLKQTWKHSMWQKVFNSTQSDPPIQPAEQFNRNRHGGRFRGNRYRGGGHRDHWQNRSGGGHRDHWQDRSGGSGGGRYGGYSGGGGGGGGGGSGRYGGYRDDRQDSGNYGSNKREWDDRRKYQR